MSEILILSDKSGCNTELQYGRYKKISEKNMKHECTGVILAGGRNMRLPGIKKTFHEIKGKKIMDIIYEIFSSIFDEIIIVTNEPQEFAGWNALIVSDIDPSRCSLAGIHAGLYYSSTKHIFVSACDTPFLKKELVLYILSQINSKFDVIIPETEAGFEALCAVYSRGSLSAIERNLKNRIYMVKRFFKKNRVKMISSKNIEKFDPQMKSFFNINTPEDLEKAKLMF